MTVASPRRPIVARMNTLGLFLLLGVCATGNLSGQCPDGTPPPCGGRLTRAASSPPNSIAVLYFENPSRDTADAAIADGLTEEIIARLSQVAGVRVASRYAVLRYRGRTTDPHQVGRDLGVRYVLGGALRRAAGRMRLVVAVTDAGAGFNVWGQTFERPMQDIFSVEDSVAVQVAEAVHGRTTAGERSRLAPVAASTDVEAYQAYLRARVAIRLRTASAGSAAIAAYQQAIVLDSRFARAWAGLAIALGLARDWGWPIAGVPADSLQPLAVRAAQRALELDSTSAEGWLAAAMVARATDMALALQLHRRALAIDSTNVEALHQLAWGFLGNGDLDSAIVFERRAVVRDPYYAYAYAGLAEMLNLAGRPEEALAVTMQGRAVDSTNAPMYWQVADAALRLGRAAEARAAIDRAEKLGFDRLGARIIRAMASLRSGDTVAVRAELPSLVQLADAAPSGGLAYSSAGALSGLYAQLGDVDSAVRWAERVPRFPRRFYAVAFARHWYWEPVRAAAPFQAFLAALRP
jgi:TolB-like protein